mmetsp:Transcript_1977/g.6525  ORF Transcript_1977/g.6525 Transcript_1977/m.6525 type:complete len:490 (-) Transcript_1977:181-1650(-)
MFGLIAAAYALLSDADVRRAQRRRPGSQFVASTVHGMGHVLNRHLRRMSERFEECDAFDAETLWSLRRRLAELADPELIAIYPHGDGRSPRRVNGTAAQRPADATLHAVQRDGLCHEVVLALVHHLAEETRASLLASGGGSALPLLPTRHHEEHHEEGGEEEGTAAAAEGERSRVFSEYRSQVSCQQCHTGAVAAAWRDATLPPPLPVDPVQPGRERLRSCDYQADPPCGPCDGLGGPRWGDTSEDVSPVRCEAVASPTQVPPSARLPGRYPTEGRASVNGGTRSPVAVRPDQPGSYAPMHATLYLGWSRGAARQRYDFRSDKGVRTASQIYLQSGAQQRRNESGAMVTVVPAKGECVCDSAIAGNMHIDSFAADALDPLQLPPEEGGLAYLGRVRLSPIDDPSAPNRTVLADHWLKWAFHFLVDADPASPSLGLPLRLYGHLGVRQIFSNWRVGDPTKEKPDVWRVPAGCKLLAEACKEFVGSTEAAS